MKADVDEEVRGKWKVSKEVVLKCDKSFCLIMVLSDQGIRRDSKQ